MLEGIEGVSTFAHDINRAFYIVNGITLFLFLVTIGSMLYFVFRYRASKNPPQNAKNIEHYTPIEIVWTVVPTILLGIVFYFGVDSLRVQRTMPSDDNSIIVKVLGQRWSWSFEYANGKKSQYLVIPVHKNIKLKMTAPVNDVLHSFYVPAFRVKEDVVPGQTTQLWFNIEKEGKYDIECAEYCGTRHSYMRSHVEVVSNEKYEEWLNPKLTKKENKTPKGLELFNQYGCVSCHNFEGTVLVGPSLNDIFNKKVAVTTDSKTREVLRDEEYLKTAILDSNKDIVEGFFPDMMPQFKGVISDEEIGFIIDYIKTQTKGFEEKPQVIESKPSGEELVQNNGCLGCHSIDGSKVVGPTFKGMFNRKEKVMMGDTLKDIVVDEEYIKTSILKPADAIVDGYMNMMPPFEGVLSNEEVDAIVEYLKTVK